MKKEDKMKSGKVKLYATAFGETKTLKEWSADPRCKISYEALWKRLDLGWDVEEALETEKEEQ